MSKAQHRGGCLCGGVRYEVIGALRDVVFCHCSTCRIQGSQATVGVGREDLIFTHKSTLRVYRSSVKARRWFCSVCGSSIYWEPMGGDFVALFAGPLEQPTGLATSAHIFVKEKADYWHVPHDAVTFEGPLEREDEVDPDRTDLRLIVDHVRL